MDVDVEVYSVYGGTSVSGCGRLKFVWGEFCEWILMSIVCMGVVL